MTAALNVGTLVGYLTIDDRGVDKGVTSATGKIQRFASTGSAEGAKAGQRIGGAAGKAITDGVTKNTASIPGAVGKQLDQSTSRVQRAGNKIKGVFRDTAADVKESFNPKTMLGPLVAGMAGLKVARFFGDSIDAASDLQQTIAKSSHIFGDQARAIEDWSRTSATAFGLSQAAALEAAATFGDMFRQLGFAGDQAASMSQDVVQLAADLGSFNNVPTAEVLDDIAGAMRGEYDALQRLIPNISAARVQQEAMAETGKTNANQLTAQEKAAATLAIIHKDGIRAAGDFARSTGQLAIEQQKATAEFENAKAEVGQKLLPVMTDLTTFASSTLIPIVGTVAGTVADVASAVSKAVGWFGQLPGPVKDTALALGAVAVAAKFGWIDKLTSGLSTAKGALGGFRASWARIGDDAAMAGVSRIRVGLGLVSDTAKKAGSSIMGAFGGPWGLAVAGATTGITLLVSAFKDGQPKVSDFTSAIDENTGALRENGAQAVVHALQQSGAVKNLHYFGISLGDYTKAVLGQGDAYEEVTKKLHDWAQANYRDDVGRDLAEKQIRQLTADHDNYANKVKDTTAAIEAAREVTDKDTDAKSNSSAATDRDAAARAAARKVIDEQTAALRHGVDAAQAKADADDEVFNRQNRGRTEVKLTKEEIDRARKVASLYGDSWQRMGGQVKVGAAAVKDARSPVERMSDAIKIFNDKVSEGDTRLKFFTISVDRLAGRNVSLEEATKLLNDQVRDVGQAFDDATKATKGHFESLVKESGQIDTTTEAGSDLYDSVAQFRNAYDTATTAAYQNAVASGHSADALKDARKAADSARARFLAQADALGINREKAEKMADAMGILEGKKLTDKQFTVKVDDQATPVVDDLAEKIRNLHDKTVVLNVQQRVLGGADTTTNFGLGNAHRATGGPVNPYTDYVVGEKGWEILRLGGTGGHVFNHEQSVQMMAASPATPVPARAAGGPVGTDGAVLPTTRQAPLIGEVNVAERIDPFQLAVDLNEAIMFYGRMP